MNYPPINTFFTYFVLLGFLGFTQTGQAQLASSEFGQHRVQYEQHKWMRYQSTNFTFLYAEKDRELLRFVLPIAEMDYAELTTLFEHQLRKDLEIIIHSDYSNYEQSNIGIPDHNINEGGTTHLLPPKMEVYFSGDHQDLRRQVRRGIAEALIMRILFGTNLQEVVQNSFLMNLPKWFVFGIIDYAAEEWNTQRDNELREALLSREYANFTALARKKPALAGHAMFHFIAQEYGPSTVANLLYLTRINRSVENGFLYVFGNNFYSVAGNNWWEFFVSRYNADSEDRRFPNQGELTIRQHKQMPKQVRLHPNGEKVAYVLEHQGKKRVVIHDVAQDKQEVVFKDGLRELDGDFDTNYPLIQWSRSGSQLVIIYQKNNKIRVRYQDGKKSKEIRLKDIERVTHFDVINGAQIALTGIKDGYSDLYLLKGSNLRPITQDAWDEADVAVANLQGERGLIFASNRNEATLSTIDNPLLPLGNKDLFFYSLSQNKNTLIRLTETPLANEFQPQAAGKGQYSYLSDLNGIQNRYVGQLDSLIDYHKRVLLLSDGSTVELHQDSSFEQFDNMGSFYLKPVRRLGGVSYANTDYSRNIEEHSIRGNKVSDLLYRAGSYHLFVRDFHPDRSYNPMPTQYRLLLVDLLGANMPTEQEAPNRDPQPKEPVEEDYANDQPANKPLPKKEERPEPKQDSIPPKTDKNTSEIDIDNYLFQSEFETVEEPKIEEPETGNEDPENITPIILTETDDGSIKASKPKNPKSNVSSPTITNDRPKLVGFESKRERKYKSLFKVKDITFQGDNTLLFGGFDMYLEGPYELPPLSLAFRTSFIDVLENFKLELGVRVPISFNGMEYFLVAENRKTRLDQRYVFYRRGRRQTFELVDSSGNVVAERQGRNIKHLIQTQVAYPLTKFHSVRGSLGAQFERVSILSEDISSLVIPNYNESRLWMRLEFLFDNTVDLRLNTRKGTRYKVFVDMFKPFGVETSEQFNVNFNGGLTTAIGFDARHYISLDDKSIIALRAVSSASFGQQKILYSLGGVENWIFPGTNNEIPLPPAQDFGLQTMAAPLRGFRNNIRNGGSFALVNAEVRIPIVDYISRRPPRNASFRNLQLVGFFDIGTAWRGTSPFSQESPLNTTLIDNSGAGAVTPIRVRVNYYRRPIVYSFGFGLRTIFLGHYVRLDYAWGVETGEVLVPRLHLAIGTDF